MPLTIMRSVRYPEATARPVQVQQRLTRTIDLTVSPEPEGTPEGCSLKFEGNLEPPKASTILCKGYTLACSNGKSPHTSYPFALHDTLVLPWDYALKNGVMSLFAQACTGLAIRSRESCQPCQLLQQNKMLEKILIRMEEGVHERIGYAYYGFSALTELFHRKTQQVKISELRGLNQAKKLIAIASGKVN
jgi:hypothetical protein